MKAEVLVVDDHPMILEGICRYINKMSEVVVADAVASGKKALELIQKRDYDIYILDISIPDLSGFDLIDQIHEVNEEPRIIINTMHEEVWIINRLAQCSVNAVTLKSSSPTELVTAVRSVLKGVPYTCARFRSIHNKLRAISLELHPNDLPTRREMQVLKAVAKGMCTHEIAELLNISENTVETFRRRLIGKFEARNAIDMVLKAVSQGLITLE